MIDGLLAFRCQQRRTIGAQHCHRLAPFRDQDFLATLRTREQFGEFMVGLTCADRLHCASLATSTTCRYNSGKIIERQGDWGECLRLLIHQPLQIPPIRRLAVARGQAAQLVAGDELLEIGDLLRATDQQPLPMLDRADELRRLEQSIVGSGVEPGITAAELGHMKFPALQIVPVDIRDLELTAGRGVQAGGDVEYGIVIEVQPGDRPIGQKLSGLDSSKTRRRRHARRPA